jgi:hypothetical protein
MALAKIHNFEGGLLKFFSMLGHPWKLGFTGFGGKNVTNCANYAQNMSAKLN